jgi:phospholipase C
LLKLNNNGEGCTVMIVDHAYKREYPAQSLAAGEQTAFPIPSANNQGWYDFSVLVKGHEGFEKRYAGRIETGRDSISDPYMGQA